jgi:hypothetical protein
MSDELILPKSKLEPTVLARLTRSLPAKSS